MELPLKREGIEGWKSVAEREIPRTGTGRYKKSLQLIGYNDFFYGYTAGALFSMLLFMACRRIVFTGYPDVAGFIPARC